MQVCAAAARTQSHTSAREPLQSAVRTLHCVCVRAWQTLPSRRLAKGDESSATAGAHALDQRRDGAGEHRRVVLRLTEAFVCRHAMRDELSGRLANVALLAQDDHLPRRLVDEARRVLDLREGRCTHARNGPANAVGLVRRCRAHPHASAHAMLLRSNRNGCRCVVGRVRGKRGAQCE
jgi:hypothetical protein